MKKRICYILLVVLLTLCLTWYLFARYMKLNQPGGLNGLWHCSHLNCVCGHYSLLIAENNKINSFNTEHNEIRFLGEFDNKNGKYTFFEEVTANNGKIRKSPQELLPKVGSLIISLEGNSYNCNRVSEDPKAIEAYKKYKEQIQKSKSEGEIVNQSGNTVPIPSKK